MDVIAEAHFDGPSRGRILPSGKVELLLPLEGCRIDRPVVRARRCRWPRPVGPAGRLRDDGQTPGTVVDEVEAAASGVHQFHGWPGAIRSNQRRTALGERFVQALGHPERIPPLTEPAPPMDRTPGA